MCVLYAILFHIVQFQFRYVTFINKNIVQIAEFTSIWLVTNIFCFVAHLAKTFVTKHFNKRQHCLI